ncbi:MAG: DNA polymerase III subunit gamma/tau [Chloroflexi bacterium]|nr:DNA polymerase III subunit gamma/tau [Chloroflexota bacterium]MCL5273448.1 DNA polymerase III subunit gamma/tau [Chloroflexota bacterium]
MAQALYRKWRPQSFDDVVGQEHITTTLKNQIATDRIGHAYLFVGSRGCGKTTTARILAKEINLAGHTADASFAARIAEGISEGRAIDLIEIDAASHTGVDAMRDVIDKAVFQPTEWRYKVYIIDEVHMLSTSAFNALLKTLEEPPPHVVFILATTDPQKIPATVLSRCQRFNFRRVPVKLIVQRLHVLCNGEGIEADEHALMLIARYATGSLRDAISLLDQLASSNSLRITADDVREALGASDSATVRVLMDGLAARDAAAGMDTIQNAIDQGADARQIARQMVDYLRAVLQVKVSQKDTQALSGELSESEKLDLVTYTDKISSASLLRGIRAFSSAINDMRSSLDAQLLLEMAYLECVIADEPADGSDKKEEDRSQRSEVRGQKSEARGQRPEERGQKSDVRGQRPEATGRGQVEPAPSGVPAAGGASGASTETLRAHWKQLIAEVNTVNKPAAALLRSCHPYSLESDIVRIKADHDLFRERLNDPKNKDVVTATLNQLLNGKYVVQVFTGQPEQEPDLNDDPVVKAAKKLGGKLRE